jgi:hypothetical protein
MAYMLLPRVPLLAVKAGFTKTGDIRTGEEDGMILLTALLLMQWAPSTTEPSPTSQPFYWDHVQQQTRQYQPTESTADRGRLIHFYRTMLNENDRNRDDRLSREEWAAMVVRGYPAADSRRARRDPAARTFYLSLHHAFDQDGDGEVTFAEMIREPLITFDCLDANRDRLVTSEERRGRMELCPARTSARPGFVAARPPR